MSHIALYQSHLLRIGDVYEGQIALDIIGVPGGTSTKLQHVRHVYIISTLFIHADKVDPNVCEEAENSMKALSQAYEIARDFAFSRVSAIVLNEA